jgi:hypothetical protein
MGEIEVLERVRHVLAPELDLERFVESSLDPGLAAARTAVLRGNAIPRACRKDRCTDLSRPGIREKSVYRHFP